MNRLFFAFVLTFSITNTSFASDFRMTCDLRVPLNSDSFPKYPSLVKLLNQLESLKFVNAITANSETNTIKVYLKSGEVETLKTMRTTITTPFKQVKIADNFNGKNGEFYTKSIVAGDIFVKHYCTLGDIPFQRCQSQGSGEHSKRFGTILNIEGQIIKLGNIFGNDNDGYFDFLCTREEI